MTGAGKGQLSLGKLALFALRALWAPYLRSIGQGRGQRRTELQLSQGTQALTGWQLSKGADFERLATQQNKGAEFARSNSWLLAGIALDGSKQFGQDRQVASRPGGHGNLDSAQQLDLTTLLVPACG